MPFIRRCYANKSGIFKIHLHICSENKSDNKLNLSMLLEVAINFNKSQAQGK